uniref:Uncharacterized protein n=1 Tax=Anguilla anguilla TaxID=7936 RepID=A0A0E9T2T8_ANGAN
MYYFCNTLNSMYSTVRIIGSILTLYRNFKRMPTIW